MKYWRLYALLALGTLAGTLPARADDPSSSGGAAPIAVFDFSLVNTSPIASSAEELARTRRLGDRLRVALAVSGRYRVVDIAPVRAKVDRLPELFHCNGCELALARELGAQQVAVGWVHKVSNLILSINLVIEDAATGRRLGGGSVDIRGNTDESWTRGLHYLLKEHVPGGAPPG